MSTVTTPVPARTDVGRDAGRSAPSATLVRRLGLGMTAGAAAWAAGSIAIGNMQTSYEAGAWYPLSSLAFQIGLVMLLTVQFRTRATGTGRIARGFMVLEHVLIAGAIGSTLNDTFNPDSHGTLVWHLLDACWPLSMLGMFGIGIRIAIAGRWKGVARFWPLVAESWALVVIPVSGAAPAIGGYVAGGHLLIGYAVLGLIIARRPGLVGAR